MIELYVDADACPVKEEIYQVASRYGVFVLVVANSRIAVPSGGGVEMVTVSSGFDAADDWIAEQIREHDIVVTADIPLASRCLEAGAVVLSPTGHRFDADSIGQSLATRELNSQLRESGSLTGGPPALSGRDRSRFVSVLDEVTEACLRASTD